jgi:hypothetical protein
MTDILLQARFGRGEQDNALLTEGWAAPEDGFAWTTNTESELILPIAPPDGRLFLELSVAPFVHPSTVPAQRLNITVNGFPVAARTLLWPATLRLDLPPRAVHGARDITITLSHPDAASPLSAGAGPDTRMLAFRITGLNLLHMAARNTPPPPAGPRHITEFRFGGNENTATLLHEGFGEPEVNYVWATGRHSALRLPATGEATILILDMNPYIAPPAATQQRIAIGVDGHLLGFVALTQRTALAFSLPPAAPGATARDVTFDNVDAAAPRDTGLYRDGSPFAFMLCSIRLAAGPANLPAETPLRPALPGTLDDGTLHAEVLDATNRTVTDIAAGFESLGFACELGLLQRRLGREPNGLLRFSGIATPTLIEGILNGFWGLGRPDTLRLHRRNDYGAGYWATDDVYELGFQTPVSSLQVSEAGIKRQLSRAMPFLAYKFFEDAIAADKIFVYQRRDRTTRPEADAVQAALSTWGDVTVLWVEQDKTRSGTAQRLGPRLLHGYVDNSGENGSGCDDAWISMLANAWVLRQAEG